MTSRRLAERADLEDGTEARTIIRQINRKYQSSQRAFRVEQVAGGFRLMTCPVFSHWLRRLVPPQTAPRLSPPALETLSIVAYRQPILKSEVEAIRGVGCGEMLHLLMERGLVRVTGRRADLGHPLEYGTTQFFLQMFGLSSLDALPRADKLRGQGLPGGSLAPGVAAPERG
jgi:segregation and condensation protein B